MIAQMIAHRSFEPAEAEIIMGLMDHRAGERVCSRMSGFRQAVHLRPPRIGQADQLGRFIEAFTRRIIHGRSQNRVLQFALHMHEDGMAAAGD